MMYDFYKKAHKEVGRSPTAKLKNAHFVILKNVPPSVFNGWAIGLTVTASHV